MNSKYIDLLICFSIDVLKYFRNLLSNYWPIAESIDLLIYWYIEVIFLQLPSSRKIKFPALVVKRHFGVLQRFSFGRVYFTYFFCQFSYLNKFLLVVCFMLENGSKGKRKTSHTINCWKMLPRIAQMPLSIILCYNYVSSS